METNAQAPSPAAVSPDSSALGPKLKLGPIQAASGAIFALFLVLHLCTAASGTLGPSRYDATLATLRSVYRPHIAVELLVIGLAGSVHIACAIAQMVRRRKIVALKGAWWMRAHRLAGYFLLLVILGHVFATRIAPTLATGPTATGKADFAFLAFASLSVPGFFWPYYLLLGIAGATHLGLGLHLASRMLRARRETDAATAGRAGGGPSPARLAVIFGFAAVVTVGVFSILWRGSEASRERFPEYKALADKLLP
ncbi:MAG TPA: hypothetical protein PKI03_08105 [Pseudomonadota bacterium]|nr:hypothetical protein [Pseudomonadota bacterium]